MHPVFKIAGISPVESRGSPSPQALHSSL
jgi:hypothetical protein